MVHGGAPNGYEGTCATLWKNFKNGKYAGWKSKGTNANSILPGDAVIMNNGNDGDASHCCIGTSKGLISCHNPSHANVPPSSTWYTGGYINDIWGVSTSTNNAIAQDKCASTGYFCGNNGLGLEPNDLYYCSEEGGHHLFNYFIHLYSSTYLIIYFNLIFYLFLINLIIKFHRFSSSQVNLLVYLCQYA